MSSSLSGDSTHIIKVLGDLERDDQIEAKSAPKRSFGRFTKYLPHLLAGALVVGTAAVLFNGTSGRRRMPKKDKTIEKGFNELHLRRFYAKLEDQSPEQKTEAARRVMVDQTRASLLEEFQRVPDLNQDEISQVIRRKMAKFHCPWTIERACWDLHQAGRTADEIQLIIEETQHMKFGGIPLTKPESVASRRLREMATMREKCKDLSASDLRKEFESWQQAEKNISAKEKEAERKLLRFMVNWMERAGLQTMNEILNDEIQEKNYS